MARAVKVAPLDLGHQVLRRRGGVHILALDQLLALLCAARRCLNPASARKQRQEELAASGVVIGRNLAGAGERPYTASASERLTPPE